MARPLRIELAGGLYHVMSRGNERRAIVCGDADRQRRLDWLQRTTEISRYIHLNPVRAKLVQRPEQWRWSSYAGYRSSKAAREWITYERVLGEFGGSGTVARRGYCRFVEARVAVPPASPWRDALGGLLVGSQSFALRIRRLLGERQADPDVPQVQRLRGRPSLDRIVSVVAEHFGCASGGWPAGTRSDGLGRAAAAYLARRRFGYSMVAIASALGYRGHSSVRTAVARLEAAGGAIQESLAALEKELTNA